MSVPVCDDSRDPTNLGGLGPAPRLSGQSQQHSIQQLIGLLVVLGDVSIAMKSEHAGVGTNRQIPNVVDINLYEKNIYKHI